MKSLALMLVALTALGLVAACGDEPEAVPTPSPQEVYLTSVHRWAFLLEQALSERRLYSQESSAILRVSTIDPVTSPRPLWMTNFDLMIRSLELIYLHPSSIYAFKGVPVPSIERSANQVKNFLRIMSRAYETWMKNPYQNTNAFVRLSDAHLKAYRAASDLKFDALKARNTGEY